MINRSVFDLYATKNNKSA